MRAVEIDGERIVVEDRSKAVLVLRSRGLTLQEVGDIFGISRERVRQIEDRADPMGTKVAELRNDRLREFAYASVDLINEVARENPGMRVNDLARAVSERLPRDIWVTEDQVRIVLGPEALKRRHVDVWDGRDIPKKYTDDEVLESLRTAFRVSEKPHLSINYYRKYEVGQDVPSSAHVIQRFGTWNEACKRAGIPHGDTNLTYTRRWTPDVCVAAVARFINEVDGNPSAGKYDEWSRGIEDVPSMATVRNRCGKWNEILKMAYAKIEGGTS